jgi:hypothetical protein
MQKVTTVIRAINTVMPECWRRKLIPCRKSAQKPVVVRRGGVLTVRHTSSMHATVRTMVAMSIVSTVVIPEEAMSNPAIAGEIRYWDAEANWTSPPARAYCSGVSRSVTVAR